MKQEEVYRADHLARQKAGPDAIKHMTNKVDQKKVERRKLADQVAKIGDNNRTAVLNKHALQEKRAKADKAANEAKQARIDAERAIENAEALEAEAVRLGGEPVKETVNAASALSEGQLRDAIEAKTGKAPHHKTGRAKLEAQFKALNQEAA